MAQKDGLPQSEESKPSLPSQSSASLSDEGTARLARREARARARDEAMQPSLEVLQAALSHSGIVIDRAWDLVHFHTPVTKQLALILLDVLDQIEHPRVAEAIVRTIGTSRAKIDGRPLTALYESTKEESLRWIIADALALARPQHVGDWIEHRLQTSGGEHADERLVLAAARTLPEDRAVPLLMAKLHRLPGHSAVALGEIASSTEVIDAVEAQVSSARTWERKKIVQAVKKINQRIERKKSS
ncbi:MAG: hypothetical protein AAF432_04815 [Planctomycetota bacterium]